MSGGPVRSLQAFLTTGAWREGAVLDELRRTALEMLADDDAVWNSDETGFPKKGTKSVGVKRQHSGKTRIIQTISNKEASGRVSRVATRHVRHRPGGLP
jgi:SRSO17 transposase